MDGGVVVLDVGKTHAKLSLWRPDGTLLERRIRPNRQKEAGSYLALDASGIEQWVAETLPDLAALAEIRAIIPVGHGAAAAVVRDGRRACGPIDYESDIPDALRHAYDGLRDPYADTGSPALPNGLNLGVQLFWLQALRPELLTGDAAILLWPQYWSWVLSGTARSEVTSLGCHTDLWRPAAGRPSALAVSQGWADRMPPLARAGDVIGTLRPEWASRTGLSPDVAVHCGIHDSNAALIAARGFAEIEGQEATVLSTGTWFVAMRTPAPGARVDLDNLAEHRDCLVNVDAEGRPVPSARFMGGREIEILTGPDGQRIDDPDGQAAMLAALDRVLSKGTMALPSFAPGFGPFPQEEGQWIGLPDDPAERSAAIALYAALVTDASLDLIGASERLLIEGRFARSDVLVRALASLRPDMAVFVSDLDNDVSYGALRLLHPHLSPSAALRRVEPLRLDLAGYRRKWQEALSAAG